VIGVFSSDVILRGEPVRTFLLCPQLFFDHEAHIATSQFKREWHSFFETISKSYESAGAVSHRTKLFFRLQFYIHEYVEE
jgi:hypothetical protein